MGDILNKQSIPILHVPSDCTVFGDGDTSIVNFADSVNRAAFFRMFGTCSAHVDGCGHCCTGAADCMQTHENVTSRLGVPPADCNNQSGPTGKPGHDWNNCNFTCPSAPSVSNVSFHDLYLDGSTSFTHYYATSNTDTKWTAGFREHGAAIYYYQGDPSQPPIRDITVTRVTVTGFAGDCLDFGGGVHNLMVQDVAIKDCLRQGVDFAGGLGYGDAPSSNFTARRVRDLVDSPGVRRGGSSIHVEEAGGLVDVKIYDNVVNHSILASGPTSMIIHNNVVEGQILGNMDKNLTISNNLVLTRRVTFVGELRAGVSSSSSTGQSMALIAIGFTTGATVTNNTLVHAVDGPAAWQGQMGIEMLGGVEHYANTTDVFIAGNTFDFHATASSVLIDMSGCENVMVRHNDFGVKGPAASHVRMSRCTNCTVQKTDDTDASPPFGGECADVKQFGAIPDDDVDDTAAIQWALNSCVESGGAVCIPAGTYTIKLTNQGRGISNVTDLCLAIPSDCTLYGEGATSILKFDKEVNENGWWRMLGPTNAAGSVSDTATVGPTNAAGTVTSNITIRDLRLNGNTIHTMYPCSIPTPGNASKPYYVCEHNALIFFVLKAPNIVRDVNVMRVILESIAGDSADFGDGVQNLLVEDVQVRDYLRQGVDLAGNDLARNMTVRRVTELPWQIVTNPGGSTLHVEEATGLRDVILADSVCNHSILASSVINLTIQNNIVHGQIVGNGNTQMRVLNNTILARSNDSMGQFLAAKGAIVSGNRFLADEFPHAGGVYFWGMDEGYPASSKIEIDSNVFKGQFLSKGKAVQLYGVNGVKITGNEFDNTGPHGTTARNNTCECCRDMKKIPKLCRGVAIGNTAPVDDSAISVSFWPPTLVALKTNDDAKPAARHTKVTCESDDCTHVLQSAINNGADIELQPGLWVVSSIYLNNSHQQVKLADGVHVKAKRGAFISPSACLFSIRGMVNVSLLGAGAANSKLSMLKSDYRNASLYKRGEWRCGVDVCGSMSVTVANLTIADTGGDGVYVGASKLGSDTFETGCTDILLQGVVTDGAYRNGLSLISGDNVLIQNCQFLRSSGTAPQAGIDIEPNGCKLPTECEHDILRNVTFKNVSSKFNNGAGLQFELYGLRLPKARSVSIVVDGMVIVGTANLPAAVKADPLNGTYNIGIDVAAIELGGATGSIIIKDVNVSDCIQPGLEVEDKVPDGTALTLERVSFKNVATGAAIRWGGANVPVLVHSAGVFQVGGMTFTDCSVQDERKRPFFVCDSCRHPNTSAVNVHGKWAVTNEAFPAACSPAWGAAAPVNCSLAVECNKDTVVKI